ncbi:interferon alpha/beta receptor 1a-like [Brienomyrus brachyistius]|uniref:interferon alpha/beta receptor 1a-like n=1 Tax=Brienomyrus brachyistius TaxID=42636 RepID=UPI0020B28AB6|nr:interferon alpha/beta receptor 1a-like [Brienomyrus brachyistius]
MKSIYCAVAGLLSFCGVSKVTAVLPGPANLTLDTLNTQYVLKWTWPHNISENRSVTFTAQYISKYKLSLKSHSWLTACENTTETWCDFTRRNLHYHGIYMLRVRTNSGTERSQWVEKQFCPDTDAALGPPSRVELTVKSSVLTVMIYNPLTSRNTSVKDDVDGLYFHIQYWKDSDQKKDYKYQNATRNLLSLSDLEPWTMYCVRVQSREGYYNKASVFSATQCQQTSGQSTVWHFMLPFLVSMLVCFLIVLLTAFVILKFYWVVKRTFFPSCQVPSSLLEYLHDSPSSSGQPSLLTLESEEICLRKLEVSPVMASLEVHVDMEPTALQANVSWHGRQDSGDSGLYSAEEHLAMLPEAQETGMMVNMGTDLEDEMSAAPPGRQCWNNTGFTE